MISKASEVKKPQRIQKEVSIVVRGKDENNDFWKLVTEIKSVSRTGAGFTLERQCQIGQLLSLMMPLPSYLRCYDEDKELYKVYGLIQHCSPISDENGAGYHIGVAFVGKHAPESYRENAHQSYKISGMSDEGFWKIAENARPFIHRKHPRYPVSISISLSIHEPEKEPAKFHKSEEESAKFEDIEFGDIEFEDTETIRIKSTDIEAEEIEIEPVIVGSIVENTMTENVSVCGALVFSKLEVNIGDCINFACEKPDFSALAIVRNRTSDGRTMPKLHLEFINAEFPIQKMNTSVETSEKN